MGADSFLHASDTGGQGQAAIYFIIISDHFTGGHPCHLQYDTSCLGTSARTIWESAYWEPTRTRRINQKYCRERIYQPSDKHSYRTQSTAPTPFHLTPCCKSSLLPFSTADENHLFSPLHCSLSTASLGSHSLYMALIWVGYYLATSNFSYFGFSFDSIFQPNSLCNVHEC